MQRKCCNGCLLNGKPGAQGNGLTHRKVEGGKHYRQGTTEPGLKELIIH